jgi:hypothetical protein
VITHLRGGRFCRYQARQNLPDLDAVALAFRCTSEPELVERFGNPAFDEITLD